MCFTGNLDLLITTKVGLLFLESCHEDQQLSQILGLRLQDPSDLSDY